MDPEDNARLKQDTLATPESIHAYCLKLETAMLKRLKDNQDAERLQQRRMQNTRELNQVRASVPNGLGMITVC